MSSSNINTTTFVPIAVYVPIAIPVSSTLTASEVQTIINNSLTSMNSNTFNFHLTQQENTKKTTNEQTFTSLSPSLSQSISQINEQNFSLIENMKKHLKEETSPAPLPSFDTQPLVEQPNKNIINEVEPTVETTIGLSDDCLYHPSETSPHSYHQSTSDLEDQMNERPIIRSTLDISLAESKTSSDLAQSLVCSNGAFSASVLRDINHSVSYFNQSLVQHCQTTSNLSLFSSTTPITTTTSSTTTTHTQTQYTTPTTNNQWCLNWDNPQCNQINQQQCCVFSNVSNEVFFPVSPRSCPPSPSSPMPMSSSSSLSPMRFSSSSLLLTLCSILLRNLFAYSALLSLRITIDLQALHYCLFKSNFKSGFSFSDQKFSESGDERREREERSEEEKGKGGKGGKGGIIIIDDAADDVADDAAAYYYADYYADHHVVHDVVHDVVVVSSLVAPVASLAIRAIA